MYRVELKVLELFSELGALPLFLMYRVELKAAKKTAKPSSATLVPNVPCGVERSSSKS